MTKPGAIDLQEAISKAADLVKELPPDLRQIAFAKAFDALTGANLPGVASTPVGKGGSERGPAIPPVKTSAAHHDELLKAIDSTAYPDIVDGKPARELALRVLKAARDSGNVEWLAPATVCIILRDKFRVAVKLNAVNMALFRAGRTVDRRKQGDGFVYRIMGAGEVALTNTAQTHTGAKNSNRRKAQKGNTLRSEASATTAKTPKVEQGSVKTRTRDTKRPGPKATLEALITTGYFAEPRTIGDIIAHVEVKQARKLKATDLSPTLGRLQREEKLDRDKNAQGQYEYRRHPKHS